MQVSANAEKCPVNDCIREKLCHGSIIFAVDGHRHPMLGSVNRIEKENWCAIPLRGRELRGIVFWL